MFNYDERNIYIFFVDIIQAYPTEISVINELGQK